MTGLKIRTKAPNGNEIAMAVRSGCSSATVFGTNSPTTICSPVTKRNATAIARVWDNAGANEPTIRSTGGSMTDANTGSPTKPRRMLAMVIPS